jgi:RNA polymerase sigma-70 factor (ECF subfamily)
MSQASLTLSFPVIAHSRRLDNQPASQPVSDAARFERFLAGENDAFVEIHRAYNRRLHLYCTKMIGNPTAAEDVVQELWERVIRMRESPSGQVRNPLGLLFTIARNCCLDYLKSPRRKTLALDDLGESAHPVDRDSMSELEELALASLDALPFESREVLVLNLYAGYRFDEIATMLGKSPEAIWARASRARAQLRKIVAAGIAAARRGTNPDEVAP